MTNAVVHYGKLVDPDSPTPFTPTISAGVGAITSATVTGEWLKIGKRVTVSVTAIINNNGTGAGYLNIAGLPFSSDGFEHVGIGINGISTKQLVAYMAPGTTNIYVRLYDSTYPVASGDVVYVTMTYLSAT